MFLTHSTKFDLWLINMQKTTTAKQTITSTINNTIPVSVQAARRVIR
jgi:hypothetical protein